MVVGESLCYDLDFAHRERSRKVFSMKKRLESGISEKTFAV